MTSRALARPRAIDPLQRSRTPGRYVDDVVVVQRDGRVPSRAVRTAHFATWTQDGKVHVSHALPHDRIDNDLAGLIAEELFAPGWLGSSDVFERVLTGVVLGSADDPSTAWEQFYANTLRRLCNPGTGAPATPGSLDAYAPVYTHATSLVGGGRVLELGCCFGFLSLQLATHARVTASDVTPNTVRLLAGVARRLERRLDTIICDAARVPSADAAYDTVLAIHLLEHLEVDHGAAVVAEMLRLARTRVVVAVPFEEEPTAAFGHVRVFGLDDLRAIGSASGWSYSCYEHHGGWLVLDRPGPRGVPTPPRVR
jgi:SAM-dependent methyltransferase